MAYTVDKNLDDLHPTLKALVPVILEKWAQEYPERHPIEISETWRSPVREDELHVQGITKATGETCDHCFMLDGKPASKAFDFRLYDEDGAYISDGTDDWYADAGAIATELGLLWGGDFETVPDYDHIQLKE